MNSTPRTKRKRLRSVTPSESGLNGRAESDVLRSPLSKRKKLAADRTGYSKLKEAITADDLAVVIPSTPKDGNDGQDTSPSSLGSPGVAIQEDEEEYEEEEEEDDFLARELEEEWG